MKVTFYDRKLTGYNDAEYKKYQPIFTNEVLRLFTLFGQAANQLIDPFGPRSCDLLPTGLLKEELVPRLTDTVNDIVEHLEGMLVEMGNGTYKLGNSASMLALTRVCLNFGNSNARNLGVKVKNAVGVIGPGCDVNNGSNAVRKELVAYASRNKLPGDDSNGCLPLFVARYTDSTEAVKILKAAVVKYIYVGIHLQSFCVKITAAQERASNVAKQLQDVGRSFRFGLSMLKIVTPTKTEPWKCERRTTPGPLHNTTSEQSTTESTVVTHNASVSTIDNMTALTPSPVEIMDLLEIMKDATNAALEKFEIKGPKAWLERVEVHSNMAREIYNNARSKYEESPYDGDAFQVLVSLLREKPKTDEHCQPIEDNSNVQGFNQRGVNYFVQYYRTDNDDCSNDLWRQIRTHESATVDAVFSSNTRNLCEKAKSEITGVVSTAFSAHCGFSGVAAVRCGYQFVWYQLGYRYFTVGRTAGTNYTLTSANDGKYNANCGQIFLFR